jgi:PAS domain S-box-containing protein
MRKAIKNKKTFRVEVTGKDGRDYELIAMPLEYLDGRVEALEVVRDISEQKQAEKTLRESEDRYRSVVENSYDSILIIDDNFRVIYANDEVTNLSGYSKEEIIGQDFRKFLDEHIKSMVETRYLRRQKGEEVPPQYEFQIVRKDGEKRDVEIKTTVIKDKRGKALSIVHLLDITERKKMENERKRFEDRLSALNMYGQSLNKAKNMEEIYRLTLDATEKTLGFEYASILMIEGKMLCLAAHRGYSKAFSLKLPLDRDKGITVKVVRTRKPVFVPDISKNKAYVKGGEGIRSELAVPIKIEKKVLGALNVESRKLSAFNEEDRKLLEILASHTAIAISNLKRQKKLSALNIYGRSLNKAESMEEIYKLTLNAMEKTLGFRFVDILLVEGKKLRLVATRGLSNAISYNLPLNRRKGVTVKAVRTGKPVFVPDIRKEKAYIEAGLRNMLSELAVPIKLGNNVLGVLNVESDRISAFSEEDRELLEILASHAAIAISNLRRQDQLRKLSKRLKYLMKRSTEIMHIKDMHQRLEVIAKAIQNFGWRRVVISLRDENLEGTDLVAAGLTKEETKLLLKRKAPGQVWRERLGPKFKQFKIGEFYYLPWSDPWIRENVHGVPPEAPPEEATTYAGVPSRLSTEEMVDWHPQDMLYAPLRTPSGKIVGILSMDDPIDGRKPTRETLAPLELFLHQAAITIENAQLIDNLKTARKQLEEYANQLEEKVEERTRELKKSQEQLLKAQRLAVIGELAGMVGHDLRNPLTSIAGAEYYLRKRLDSKADAKIKEMLELIEKNIAYSNKIINDLLEYSREVKLDVTESSPKIIISEALSLIEVPEGIKIIDLTKKKPKIRVDVGKIERAFINIIKNAIEAMSKGGSLTIKSDKINGNVAFSFSDTGTGMPKETIEKLWTPLFTTKAKGMGFGLPICKRIIEAHGGIISVESIPRKGTTFTVTIPIEPKTEEEEGGEKAWVESLESLLSTTMRT